MKTRSENIDAVMRRRRVLSEGFVSRMEGKRLPKCVIFVELIGGADCVESKKKSG